MDASLLHPSRFLKAAEFKGKDVTYTVRAVEIEELESDDGKKKTKGIMSFVETGKQLVINRTNSDCFKAMFGRETDNWVGKRVTFWPAPYFDSFSKEHMVAVRVRGSPDITAPVSATIKLARKKATTVTMQKTGGVAQGLVGDALEAEIQSITDAIDSSPTPEACDATWMVVLNKGTRVTALPPQDRDRLIAHFKKHKNAVREMQRALNAPVEAPNEAPPPAA